MMEISSVVAWGGLTGKQHTRVLSGEMEMLNILIGVVLHRYIHLSKLKWVCLLHVIHHKIYFKNI